jgi:uncharacterized protein involved in exopolysaccharide biosynthesis
MSTETQRDAISSSPLSGDEIGVLDLLIVVARRKAIVIWTTAAAALLAVVVTLLSPNTYTAETKILPPQQSQSIAATMMGQLGPLAGLATKDLGFKSPSDVYVAILESRTVGDALVDRFQLQQIYKEDKRTDTLEKLAKRSKVSTGKDNLITVAVEDKDPKRAAAIANAYIEELYKLNQKLAITEASQRRLFFERELEQSKNRLRDAELALKTTQEKTGLIQLDGQAKAIIEAVAVVRAQVAAKEVQLRSMQSFGTSQNPDVQRAEVELAALRAQLAKLQRGQTVGQGDIQVPTGSVPEAGMAYIEKLRDVKYNETVYEVLAKQYEIAKIDESKNASVIQVMDVAVPPEKKSGPKRMLIVLFSTMAGCFLSICWAFMVDAYERMQGDPVRVSKLYELRGYVSGRIGS